MTVTREEFTLQSLHLTQNDHSAALRGLRTGQDELRLGQEGLRRELTEMRVELTETRVGVQTIIDLLNSAGEEESGGSSPN